MSQDLRKYRLKRVDENGNEASELSVTATVGPTPESDTEREHTRGVQLTLRTPNGYAYARVSEQQIHDLMRVLETRVNSDAAFEATGHRADELVVTPGGDIDGRVP